MAQDWSRGQARALCGADGKEWGRGGGQGKAFLRVGGEAGALWNAPARVHYSPTFPPPHPLPPCFLFTSLGLRPPSRAAGFPAAATGRPFCTRLPACRAAAGTDVRRRRRPLSRMRGPGSIVRVRACVRLRVLGGLAVGLRPASARCLDVAGDHGPPQRGHGRAPALHRRRRRLPRGAPPPLPLAQLRPDPALGPFRRASSARPQAQLPTAVRSRRGACERWEPGTSGAVPACKGPARCTTRYKLALLRRRHGRECGCCWRRRRTSAGGTWGPGQLPSWPRPARAGPTWPRRCWRPAQTPLRGTRAGGRRWRWRLGRRCGWCWRGSLQHLPARPPAAAVGRALSREWRPCFGPAARLERQQLLWACAKVCCI